MNITLPQIKKIAKNITADAKNLYSAKNLKHSIVLDIIARSLDSKNFGGLSSRMKKETDYSNLCELTLEIPSLKINFFIGVFSSADEARDFIPIFIANIKDFSTQLKNSSFESSTEKSHFQSLSEDIYGHKIPAVIDFSLINYGYQSSYKVKTFHLLKNSRVLSSVASRDSELRTLGQRIIHFSMDLAPEDSREPNHLFFNTDKIASFYLDINTIEGNIIEELLVYLDEEFSLYDFRMDPLIDEKNYAVCLALLQTLIYEYKLSDPKELILKKISELSLSGDVLLYSNLTLVASRKIKALENGETLLVILPHENILFYRGLILDRIPKAIKDSMGKALKSNDPIDVIFSQARASIDKVFLITSREELNKYSDASRDRLFANTEIMNIS